MDATEPRCPTLKGRRRWFQYSLRTLLLVMLLASVGMSWFSVQMRRAEKQQAAVRAISEAGGGAVYDFQVSGTDQYIDGATNPWPMWLYEAVGIDLLANIAAVNIATDAEMKELASLQHVRSLSAHHLTDDGLRHVATLGELQELLLQGSQVTDAGAEHLKGLSTLRTIDLGRTKITDAGLRHLEGLRQLQLLSVWGNKITDAGLVHIAKLPQLRTLSLAETQVTDAGLEHLRTMQQLNTLNLTETTVTDTGVGRLQQALPNCMIEK